MLVTQESTLFLVLISLATICVGDVLVQLNVNKPLSDVNEKFVSFSIKPEDLYTALDGPKRKIVTRTAAMLGTSYIKYLDDYNFQDDKEARSPSRVIWKGFNRWSKAINWTMIIPIKYNAEEWNPMDTLNILNNSHMSGINDCIWQFGTDYSSNPADNYMADYKTFDLMLDAFRPNVKQWKIMGADVSAGSNADDTRRYVDMSRDFSTAYAWTRSSDDSLLMNMSPFNMDSSLRMLLTTKVPVWLNLVQTPKTKKLKPINSSTDELKEGMSFAQALGDAANNGFDAVFKPISVGELENPSFSMYVAALHKKVMGSRVFPVRPLHLFNQRHKLYTHCANSVSGGIAFMVINRDETPLHITVGSFTRLKSSEVWQYSLTLKKGAVLLNNERLTYNSSLEPLVKLKNPNGGIQLAAPALSVTYWILPGVNLEHCQFLEVEIEDSENYSTEDKILHKRHSATEKLISQLIRETALTQQGSLRKSPARSRRFASAGERSSRVARSYDDDRYADSEENTFFPNNIFNEDNYNRIRREMHKGSRTALDWIQSLIEIIRSYDDGPPKSLRRRTRSIHDDFGSLFSSEEVEKDIIVRDNNDVHKKAEKKEQKMFDVDNFDEEAFFKKLEDFREPRYFSPPEGDVHLRYISNVNGEDIDDSSENRKMVKKSPPAEIVINDMKPMRFLKTDFNDGESSHMKKKTTPQVNMGSSSNYLLSPEPFTTKQHEPMTQVSTNDHKNRKNSRPNNHNKIEASSNMNQMEEIQKELQMAYMRATPTIDDNEHIEHYMDELRANSHRSMGSVIEEPAWWNLDPPVSKRRQTRGLKFILPVKYDEDSNENMIDDTPIKSRKPQYVRKTVQSVIQQIPNKKSEESADNLLANDFVDTVTKRVVKFVDIVTRHVNNLYATFAKKPEENSQHTKKVNNISKF